MFVYPWSRQLNRLLARDLACRSMHRMSPPQSSDMVRRDSGNSIEDYKTLQSAAVFAQFTPSSKVSPSSTIFFLVRMLSFTLADFDAG